MAAIPPLIRVAAVISPASKSPTGPQASGCHRYRKHETLAHPGTRPPGSTANQLSRPRATAPRFTPSQTRRHHPLMTMHQRRERLEHIPAPQEVVQPLRIPCGRQVEPLPHRFIVVRLVHMLRLLEGEDRPIFLRHAVSVHPTTDMCHAAVMAYVARLIDGPGKGEGIWVEDGSKSVDYHGTFYRMTDGPWEVVRSVREYPFSSE